MSASAARSHKLAVGVPFHEDAYFRDNVICGVDKVLVTVAHRQMPVVLSTQGINEFMANWLQPKIMGDGFNHSFWKWWRDEWMDGVDNLVLLNGAKIANKLVTAATLIEYSLAVLYTERRLKCYDTGKRGSPLQVFASFYAPPQYRPSQKDSWKRKRWNGPTRGITVMTEAMDKLEELKGI